MSVIKIRSNIRDYQAHFGKTQDYLKAVQKRQQPVCFVIDENVWRLYAGSALSQLDQSQVIILPIKEEKKNLSTVQGLYDSLMDRSAKRNLLLVSIGGGITQDITGFLASTLYRGITWLFIPTTLLAQADSCIGSKTSLNYKNYKNLVGTFFPPHEVLIDPVFVNTLQEVDFYSGLGEIIKLQVMGGVACTRTMLREFGRITARQPEAISKAVKSSLLIKKSYIEGDEFDSGRRNLLNYGHCVGHAMETSSKFKIPHGQAVLLGMAIANLVAKKRGLLASGLESFLREELFLPALKVKLRKAYLDAEIIVQAMKKDKKRTGTGLPLVMIADKYKMLKVSDVTPQEIVEALRQLRADLTFNG